MPSVDLIINSDVVISETIHDLQNSGVCHNTKHSGRLLRWADDGDIESRKAADGETVTCQCVNDVGEAEDDTTIEVQCSHFYTFFQRAT